MSSLGATNSNVGFGVSQGKKKIVNDVDIHLISEEELQERIGWLKMFSGGTTRKELEELGLMLLTGCPF